MNLTKYNKLYYKIILIIKNKNKIILIKNNHYLILF